MGTSRDPADRVDAARIAARLDALWDVAQAPGGGGARPAWSPAEAAAMRLVAGWTAEAGLDAALDAHGNLWALPAGDDPVVTSGSHVDTVPAGGRYDGALGTVLALEAATALGGRAGVLTCAAEEAPRFAAGTLGSRLLTGALDEGALHEMRDRDGTTAAAARDAFLSELDDLPRLPGPPPLARLRAHAEVHIEPRHELRARGAALGVVERIAAPHRHELTVTGEAGPPRGGGLRRPPDPPPAPAPPRPPRPRRGGPRGRGRDARPPRRARRGRRAGPRARGGRARRGRALARDGRDRRDARGRARRGQRDPGPRDGGARGPRDRRRGDRRRRGGARARERRGRRAA